MKKIIIILSVTIICLCKFKEEKVVIPKESIRFRVIASSNEKTDQDIKKIVVSNIYNEFSKVKLSKDINIAHNQIKNELPKINDIVESTFYQKNYNNIYNIEFGKNYFPRKEYKKVIYEEGEYDSLVVTLGKGKGENFWCVLFPPLCLLEGDNNNTKDVEYTSFVKEIIKKYF